MPDTLFNTCDQLLGKLAQIAAIATLNPATTVGTVVLGASTAAGASRLIALLAAVGGMYYLSALAGSMFFASAEGQYCKNTNSLNAAMLANWMRSKGICNVENLDAEFLKNPRLGMA